MKNKYFINFIQGYFKSLHDFSKDENPYLHPFQIACNLNYKCIAIVNQGYDILKTDPHLEKHIEVIEFKNYFQYILLLFRFGFRSIFYKTIFYTNGHTSWQYITIIIAKIFSFGRIKNIFMAHTQPKRGGLGNSNLKQFIQNKILFNFFVDRVRLNNITEKNFLLIQGVKENKLFIVPLVVDNHIFNKINDYEDRQDLLYFGQLSKKKNINTILKATKILKERNREYKNIKLNIIGKIAEDYDINRDILDLDLKENIIIHGFMKQGPELNNLMNKFLISINSSKDEGQCLTVFESAMSGCSLCLPNIMSFVDVFKNKALFHYIHDAEKLSENILFYLENKNLSKEYNEKCIEMIKKDYNVDIIKEKMRELFIF